jgi:N-acetylmuramoyl-L-alanine amidase
MTVVMVDAGHGGRDPGTSGFGLLEKRLTLNIAKKVQRHLSGNGITVHMTRKTDTFVSLGERTRMANAYNADLFVSFHHNAGGGEGFESYIYPGLNHTKTGFMQDQIHAAIMDFYVSYDLKDRGKKEANFAVLRETKMPAILLENLFLDSATDTKYLKQAAFVKGLSSAIAKGILKAVG